MNQTKRRGLLVTLFLGVLLAALDIAVLGPAIPAIREHFGIDDRTVSWVFNTFVFFNLMGVPVMTKVSDVFGRRNVYMTSIALFGTGAVIVAAAPSISVLLAGRALQGVGASGIFPVAAAVVGDVYPAEQRGRALGILGAVFGVAFIIGPLLAGVLLLVDWRAIYVAYVPLAILVLVLASRRIPTRSERTRRPLDWAGLAILGVVLVSLAYGVNRLDTTDVVGSLMSPRVWVPMVVVVLGLPALLYSERRAIDPVLRPGLFRNRQVRLAAALAIGAGLSESAFIFLPALAIAAFGVSQSTASFMLLPLVSAIVVVSPLAGRILDRVGSRTIVLACQAMLVAGMAVVAFFATNLTLFYVGTVLIGAGLAGIMGPSLSYILLDAARETERAVSQGLITLFISIGQLVGGAMVGAIAASVGSGAESYMQAFVWIAAAGVVIFLLAMRLRGRTEEVEERSRGVE